MEVYLPENALDSYRGGEIIAKNLRKGDKVQVKAGLGYGTSVGTIKGKSGGLYKVRFTTLRKATSTYTDPYGKKKTIKLGKTGTFYLPAGSLKRQRKKRKRRK